MEVSLWILFGLNVMLPSFNFVNIVEGSVIALNPLHIFHHIERVTFQNQASSCMYYSMSTWIWRAKPFSLNIATESMNPSSITQAIVFGLCALELHGLLT